MARITFGFVVAVLLSASCSPAPPAERATHAEPIPILAGVAPLDVAQLPLPVAQPAEIAAADTRTPEEVSELVAAVARLSERVRVLEEELARRDAQAQPAAAVVAAAGTTALTAPATAPQAQPTPDPPQRDRTFTPTAPRARANWPAPLPRGYALQELISAACPGAAMLGEQRPDSRTRDEGCRGVQEEAYRGLLVRQINTPAKRAVRIRCSDQSYSNLARWNTCEAMALGR